MYNAYFQKQTGVRIPLLPGMHNYSSIQMCYLQILINATQRFETVFIYRHKRIEFMKQAWILDHIVNELLNIWAAVNAFSDTPCP